MTNAANILLAIQNGFWLIDPNAVESYLPLIQNMYSGNSPLINNEEKKPAIYYLAADGETSFGTSVKPNSTAVLEITGAIMKYDNCGAPGSKSLSYIMKQLSADPNVSSIVLYVDSPGGTVAGTQDFAQTIKNAGKPVVAVASDLMASAAYWLGSQATEIYAENDSSRIGSIGTMLSFADMQPMWEQKGVKFHNIYADASTEKNADFMQARQGNYAGVKETLNALNDKFLSAVKDARGEKLNAKETLSGKVFMANDAIKNGLIDGIMSLDQAIARAQELANQRTNQSNNNQSQNNMKVKAMWASMVAFLGAAFTGFKADETPLTEEHLEKMNAELAKMDQLKADLDAANAAKKTAEDALTAKVNELATVNETIAAKDAEIAKLKGTSAGATQTIDDGSAAAETEDKSWLKEVAGLEHNKVADSLPYLKK